MMPVFIQRALALLRDADWLQLLRTYWYFVLLDFPRYFITDLIVVFAEPFRRFIGDRNEEKFLARLESDPPLVSIVLPVLNEQETITWTVQSMLEQSYRRLELIIVDDGSTDATPDICKRLEKTSDKVSYVQFSERSGKSAALNYGLSHCHGEFVVFADSDTTFDTDAIYNIIKPFGNPKVGAVSGNLAPRNREEGLLPGLQGLEYLFGIEVGRRVRALFGTLPIVSGAFGAFRREVISPLGLGGHEPGPGNDSDLTMRVRKRGYSITFAPEAYCLTHVPDEWPSLAKQRTRWARNLIKNRLRKHGDELNPFSGNFQLRNAISSIDSLFFHVVLAVLTVVYLGDIAWNFPEALPTILLANYAAYFLCEVAQFILAMVLNPSWRTLASAPYIPLYNPYKIIMKFIRLTGYLQELCFRSSQRDGFAPQKVQRRMIRW